MNFKEQLACDLKDVFHRTDEFFHDQAIYYDNKWITVPMMMDDTCAKDRKKSVNDHVEGLYRSDAKVYVAYNDLGFMPRKGAVMQIDDTTYIIAKAAHEAGEIILDLEMLDE